VFDWNGSAWVQVGADLDGEAAGDRFGRSVSLSGDGSRLAAGGWGNDGNGTDAGHVRVLKVAGESQRAAGTRVAGAVQSRAERRRPTQTREPQGELFPCGFPRLSHLERPPPLSSPPQPT